ncbi:hypothetical protein EDB84DRAFT_1438797 [Lactarius hengduanensis]|nr:hypothetical protein EDB84DRAFT_1438797 [Lactarius hengduanensis]
MGTNNIVSKAEIELLAIACRLDTALRYQDEHREEPDDDWIRQGIENEMLGINEIFREAGTTVPRLPAFLRMIGERSERALQLQEVMDLDDLSTEEMKAYCTSIANDNPQWNSLLTMHSPRDLAPQLGITTGNPRVVLRLPLPVPAKTRTRSHSAGLAGTGGFNDNLYPHVAPSLSVI